jgi:hypothetical protein
VFGIPMPGMTCSLNLFCAAALLVERAAAPATRLGRDGDLTRPLCSAARALYAARRAPTPSWRGRCAVADSGEPLVRAASAARPQAVCVVDGQIGAERHM